MDRLFIGVVYTEDNKDNDIVSIYAKDRAEADELLKQYSDSMYGDVEEIKAVKLDTYIPDAPDAIAVSAETIKNFV